ncbi:MAG: PEP-CTERM sorting domain-containing protein [Pirellulales bacterium]|nr:PEP-CTERM sorting domain-containing protein [Pirellulales bacterium]
MRTASLTGLIVALSIASAARDGLAQVNIGFEAPTYATGNLVGQDGWIKNTYYGAINGNVTVSSTAPLAGARSMAYTQTVAGGFSDVGRLDTMLVAAGVAGTDVTLSYVIKATTNAFGSPVGGLFLGNGAPFGASPIFARINGGVVEVGSAGAIVPVNSFFFLEGERLKMTYEIDFDAATMNFIVENLEFGDVFTQNYPFFAPYGAATGPNGEFEVDLGVFLRGGNVQIDDITLTAGVGPLITEFEWTATGSGNWNQGNNWTPTGVPGTLPGRQTATLGASITANATIYNNATRTLNALEIDNANGYHIGGTGSLDFQEDASGPTTIAPSITVANGAHQIQLAVNLNDNTSITVAGGASLDLNNQIDLNGNTLTTSGTVRINHSTIGGGTVNSTGALAANGASDVGGNLVSTGSLVIGADEEGADSFNVLGDASLSGILDVMWSGVSLPAGTFTVVSAGGTLDASGLSLAADDARSFVLGTDGNNLTLTFLGAAVPEPTSLGMFVFGLVALVVRRPRAAALRVAACVAATTTMLGAAGNASAVSFNFENPPYTPGTLIGQDSWITNGYVLADPFFGGVVNGTVEVSAASPLAGAQSVLYTQTVDPPLAGGSGASDVGRPFAVFGTADGTTAVDLTASFLIRADSNGIGNGSMGFFLGRGGRSPILVLLTEANSGAGTGNILVGDGGALPSAGAYVPNNTYEFTFGVDFDNDNYEVTSRNVTAGTPAVTLTGSGPGGRFPYFGGDFGDDGDGVTYTLDTSVILRSGTGRVDNITAVGDDFVEAVWNGSSGDWNRNAAWIPQLIPNATASVNAPIAVFKDRFTEPHTAFTNTTQTVNGLRFDNATKYVIAGSGSIALRANTIGGTVNPTINVVSGAHELQAAVSVLNNTAVTVAASSTLDVNSSVALGGRTLTNSGAGVLNLNVGVTGGGAVSNSGTLGTAGATPIAANLTSTGTLQVDLGVANTDRFNITGTATLSGLLDVVMEPGFTPTGSYTVLTSTGALNATGLTLHPSDLSAFTLSIAGNSVVLTTGGSVGIPGDFDGNGTVNGADLTQWRGDFGINDESDADGDNDSDGNDFLIWQRNLGQTAATPTAASVPEPASLLLVAMTLAACGALARRRCS